MKRHLVLVAALVLGACTGDDVSIPLPDASFDGWSTTADVSVAPEASPDGSDDRPASEGGATSDDAAAADDGGAEVSETVDGGAEVSTGTGGEDAPDGQDESAGGGNPLGDAPGGNPFGDATLDSPSSPLFDPCVANPRPGFDPESTNLARCCAGVGAAHCVPKSEVAGGLAEALTSCDDVSVCMPDAIIRAGAQYRPLVCASLLGPGVCLSPCIGLIRNNPQAGALQQGNCGAGDLCVPCFTGACDFTSSLCPANRDAGTDAQADDAADVTAPFESGGDGSFADATDGSPDTTNGEAGTPADGEAGALCPYRGPPLVDPAIFPACDPACGGAHCIPQAALPQGSGVLSECPSLGGVPGFCAPDPVIAGAGNFVPRSCTSLAGAEGRCLSTCIPAVSGGGVLLPVDVCGPGEKCAPCFDPTAADPTQPTGACSIACDAPTLPPVTLVCPWTGPALIDPATLPACAPACDGAHCMPSALVPNGIRSQLVPCPGGLCAPDSLVTGGGNAVPPTCVAFADTTAPGRCLSTCFPSVAAEPSLESSTCAAGSKCVPCNDPFTGAETGACSTASCDAPPATPFTFAGCCPTAGGFDGRCVPRSQIPDAQEPILLAGACPGASFCVPNDVLPGAPAPATCTGSLVLSPLVPPIPYSGLCLSSCLNLGVFAAAPQGDCTPNHVCMPCTLVPTAPGCQ